MTEVRALEARIRRLEAIIWDAYGEDPGLDTWGRSHHAVEMYKFIKRWEKEYR